MSETISDAPDRRRAAGTPASTRPQTEQPSAAPATAVGSPRSTGLAVALLAGLAGLVALFEVRPAADPLPGRPGAHRQRRREDEADRGARRPRVPAEERQAACRGAREPAPATLPRGRGPDGADHRDRPPARHDQGHRPRRPTTRSSTQPRASSTRSAGSVRTARSRKVKPSAAASAAPAAPGTRALALHLQVRAGDLVRDGCAATAEGRTGAGGLGLPPAKGRRRTSREAARTGRSGRWSPKLGSIPAREARVIDSVTLTASTTRATKMRRMGARSSSSTSFRSPADPSPLMPA